MSLALGQQASTAQQQQALSQPTPQQVTDPDYNPFSVRPFIAGIEAPKNPTGRSSATLERVSTRAAGSSPKPKGVIRVRVGDLARVRGQEDNVVQGIGLVIGLQGSGDSGTAMREALRNLNRTQNINLNLGDISSSNAAIVLVQASLPASVKPGRKIDVRVSSLYDCESLVGGVLVQTLLTDMTGTVVYASAEGPITTGAFSAGGEAATVTKNHLTVGRIPNGGKVERAVKSEIVNEHGTIFLDLMTLKGSYENSVRITEAINEVFPGAAESLDAMTVSVQVPPGVIKSEHIRFLTDILEREIVPATNARIIINERTGVIIMGEDVRITPGAIAQGSLTIKVANSPEASQPQAGSNGSTEVLPRDDVTVTEEVNPVQLINGAVTLEEVVEIMNLLGASPRDMIQILQSMAQQGMLHADILVL